MVEPDVNVRKTISLRLTRYELLHLRDLFSIMLPLEMKVTVSQALANQQQRTLIESRLWQKIIHACADADVPLGDEAPDFVVAASSAPSVDVFELAHDTVPIEHEERPVPVSNIFEHLGDKK